MNAARRSLVTSTFSGMFLWGVIASIAPLGKSWPFVPDTGIFRILLVVIGPSFSLFGSFLMGYISDSVGRRKIFIATIALYSVGLAVISLSFSVFSLLFGIALSHFGVLVRRYPPFHSLPRTAPENPEDHSSPME
jgi:Sugar (and other) transporter.